MDEGSFGHPARLTDARDSVSVRYRALVSKSLPDDLDKRGGLLMFTTIMRH